MKLSKEQLELRDGITKEWLITNGIGGYASSSVLGINTRKYHGLLVASLTPPARRYVILSKVDESVEIENKKYNLYIHKNGHVALQFLHTLHDNYAHYKKPNRYHLFLLFLCNTNILQA